jgi:hypothetical protein
MAWANCWGIPSLVRYQPKTAEVATISMITAVCMEESMIVFQKSR